MNKRNLLLSMALLAAMTSASVPSPAYAGDESLTVMAKLHVTPGREAEAGARLIKFTEYIRKTEPGATFRVFQSKNDPALFSTFEVYPSSDAFKNHVNVVIPAYVMEAGPNPE